MQEEQPKQLDDSQQDTLTVFLPNYNHGRFLPEALDSLERQTRQPLEIHLVDDGSTDDSVSIIEAFAAGKPHVQVILNEVNRGVIFNENRSLASARGAYFFGMSADDRIDPTLFEKSMALLARYPQAGFCSALSKTIDEQGNDLGPYPVPKISDEPCYIAPAEVLELLDEHGLWFMGNTTIWRRDALLEQGRMPQLKSFYDGFMSQVLALRYGVCFLPESLGEFRQVPGQLSESSYDAATAFPIYRQALELMRTEYSDLFPPEYVDRFERRTLAYTMERSITGSNQRHYELLQSMTQEARLRDRVLLGLVWLSMRLQQLLAKTWLVVAVRRETWPAIGRAIKNFFKLFTPR